VTRQAAPAVGPDGRRGGRVVVGVTAIPRHCRTPMSVLPHETVPELYLDALRRAGAVPLALPVHGGDAAELVGRVDGVLLTGGGDVDPATFGRDGGAAEGVDGLRDAFELAVVRAALDTATPLFGICRGLQVLNVALGGTLVGDLPAERGTDAHWDTGSWGTPVHPVRVEPGTRLFGVTGPVAEVNSMHHQAVDRLGTGLVVAARAPDGVVEAVEWPGRPVLAVQWHPECLAPAQPHQGLFDVFVRECQQVAAPGEGRVGGRGSR
jgi:putative glutamine amidotransferase